MYDIMFTYKKTYKNICSVKIRQSRIYHLRLQRICKSPSGSPATMSEPEP